MNRISSDNDAIIDEMKDRSIGNDYTGIKNEGRKECGVIYDSNNKLDFTIPVTVRIED